MEVQRRIIFRVIEITKKYGKLVLESDHEKELKSPKNERE
jgi:hypothetical protein